MMDKVEAARFWAKVDKNGPAPPHRQSLGRCWVWTGTARNGYGLFCLKGKMRSAHRVSWESVYSPIPSGMQILHKCDNRLCCRWAHLHLGTQRDNMRDCVLKGRSVTPDNLGASNGMSKLSEDDVLAIRRRHAGGERTRGELATEYGVTIACVDQLLNRSRWAHVPRDPETPVARVLHGNAGARGGGSKLTEGQVIQIRRRRARGGVTLATLARDFEVSAAAIQAIVSRKNWKHIPEEVS